VVLAAISGLAIFTVADTAVKAAGKDSVTVSVVLALAAGEWSTEILAGANAAAKDPNGKVKVRVTGPTTFDPQRQVQMFLVELETKPDVLIVVNVARSSSAQAWPARFGPLYMPRSTRAALP
jgi:ABC-type sugar transport system substrate-binding protein